MEDYLCLLSTYDVHFELVYGEAHCLKYITALSVACINLRLARKRKTNGFKIDKERKKVKNRGTSWSYRSRRTSS